MAADAPAYRPPLTAEQRALIARHQSALRDYRRAGSALELPEELVPLCRELGLLPSLAAGTSTCRLAPLCDAAAAIWAAPAAHGPPGTATQTLRQAQQNQHNEQLNECRARSPANAALRLLAQLELREGRPGCLLPRLRPMLAGAGGVCAFFFSWVGNDQDALLALRACCAESAADGLRRALHFRLRGGGEAAPSKLAKLLAQLRAAPQRLDVWAAAQNLLEEHCLGERAPSAEKAPWAAAARCARCPELRASGETLCLRCMRAHERGSYDARSLATEGRLVGPADCMPEEAARRTEQGCLARCAPAEHAAPLMRALGELREAQPLAAALGARHLWRRYAPLQIQLERMAPGLRAALRQGSAAVDALLAQSGLLARLSPASADALLCEGAEECQTPHLLFAALPASQPTPAAVEQLRLLRCVLGMRAPMLEALTAGDSSVPRSDAAEELRGLLSDPELHRRLALRASLLGASSHATAQERATPLGRVGELRRRLVPSLLRAEERLALAAAAGDWSLRAAQARLAPHLSHQPACDAEEDDPRPRPPSQLLPARPNTLAAREAAQSLWTLAALQQPPTWLRVQRSLAAARAADASKVSKSWATVCLQPALDEPAEVPQLGFGQAHGARPLGHSRLFRWRPRADERLLREELAQMEGVADAMEPQELYVQHIGVLKKAAVAETLHLHQRGGHSTGCAVQSPLCRDHERPTAALWCSCAVPNQYCGAPLLCERWLLPSAYLARQEWREPQQVPRAAPQREPRQRLQPGYQRRTPQAPDEPLYRRRAPALDARTRLVLRDGSVRPLAQLPASQLASELAAQLAAPSDARLCWPLGADGPALDAALLVAPAPHLPAESADAWRTCPAPRLAPRLAPPMPLLHLDFSGVLHLEGGATLSQPPQGCWQDAWGRPAHPLLRLQPTTCSAGDARCVGSLLSLPPPAPRRRPTRSAARSAATPLELALLFDAPRAEPQPRAPALHLVGHHVRRFFCARCALPAAPDGRCPACAAPASHAPPCTHCGQRARMAVTTGRATEEWVCASCGRTAAAQRAPDSQMRLLRRHPAVHALAAPAPAAHDGTTLHGDAAALQRALARRRATPTLSQDGRRFSRAALEQLRDLPLHSLTNDPAAAAALLGVAASRAQGSLLQKLTHHHRRADTAAQRPTPLQAARTPGALATL